MMYLFMSTYSARPKYDMLVLSVRLVLIQSITWAAPMLLKEKASVVKSWACMLEYSYLFFMYDRPAITFTSWLSPNC